MSKKSYVCHVNNCKYNDQGSCNSNQDSVVIALYDGVAQCPNYEQTCVLNDSKAKLAADLLHEINNILIADNNPLEEDLGEFELFTDKAGVSYMLHKDDGNYMQDFACSEEIATMVNAFNVLTTGKVQQITWQG